MGTCGEKGTGNLVVCPILYPCLPVAFMRIESVHDLMIHLYIKHYILMCN